MKDESTRSRSCQFISNLDLLIIRELTSGIYFGEPRGIEKDVVNNQGYAYNTMIYYENEIKRIAKVAFTIPLQQALGDNKQHFAR